MVLWARAAMPASEYFGALSYGAFLMSFGIILLKFGEAVDERPDWVYQVCAIVMCLMSCGVAYTAQFVHVKTESRGLTYDLLLALHMAVSASVAAAVMVDTWPFSAALEPYRGHRVAIVLPVAHLLVAAAVAYGMLSSRRRRR